MAQRKTRGTNAPFVSLHNKGFRRFENLSQEEQVQRLIKIGILNKDGELSRRYGGGSSKNGKSEGKRAAKATG